MNARMKEFENMVMQKADMVFYLTNKEKAWLGPAKVMDVDKTGYKMAKKLEILKLEDNEFRFTGMDVKKDGDVIVVSMENLAESRKYRQEKRNT